MLKPAKIILIHYILSCFFIKMVLFDIDLFLLVFTWNHPSTKVCFLIVCWVQGTRRRPIVISMEGQLRWSNALWFQYKVPCPFTKPPLFQRNGLTCSGNPLFESCVEGKAKQREIAVYSRSFFQRPQH